MHRIAGVDYFFTPSCHIIWWQSEQQLSHVYLLVEWGLAFKCKHTEKRAVWVYVLAASASLYIYQARCSMKIMFRLTAEFTAAETCFGGERGHFQAKKVFPADIMHHPVLFSEHGSCIRSQFTSMLYGCIRAWPATSIDCYDIPYMGLTTCFLLQFNSRRTRLSAHCVYVSSCFVHVALYRVTRMSNTDVDCIRVVCACYKNDNCQKRLSQTVKWLNIFYSRAVRACSCLLAAYHSPAGWLLHRVPSDMHGYAYKQTR